MWEYFKPARSHHAEPIPQLAEFAEAIWQAFGGNDADVGLRLVDQLMSLRSKPRAMRVIQQLLDLPDVQPQTVVGCINRLLEAEEYQQAQALIAQWGGTLADNPEFQAVWASLVVRQRDAAAAKELFESKEFRPAIILAKRPQVYVQLLRLADRQDEMEAALQSYLDQAIASGDADVMIQTGMMFEEFGRSEVFKGRVREALPRSRAERILRCCRITDGISCVAAWLRMNDVGSWCRRQLRGAFRFRPDWLATGAGQLVGYGQVRQKGIDLAAPFHGPTRRQA